jgi:hypothetical protein
MSDEDLPGTWRPDDGSAFPFAKARELWAVAARDVLIATARRYHAYVTYGELALAVQKESGVETRSQMRNWIGGVLGMVADDCRRRGEPALTALCVRQDETVGDGYRYVIESAGERVPEDLDQHAAEARLECYRFFGAELPENGGRPALTRRVAEARKRAAKAQPERPPICRTCFTQLPRTGQCDNCS